MEQPSTITLVAIDGWWMAKHEGACAAEIADLFGIDTLPTPFMATESRETVRAEIARRNPGIEVR